MYPGYSPADFQYGKAAKEFGKEWAEARKQGYEFKPPADGPEYKIGQAKGIKRQTLAQIREAKRALEGGVETNGSGGPQEPAITRPTQGDVSDVPKGEEEDARGGQNPYFVVDTNPTPVNLQGLPAQRVKRQPSQRAENRSKKRKITHESEATGTTQEPKIEYEDIAEEVDARMKEKEKKRKFKERKRKRESNASEDAQEKGSSELLATPAIEEPKKKKRSRKSRSENIEDVPEDGPRKREGTHVDEAGEKKKKKKKKIKE